MSDKLTISQLYQRIPPGIQHRPASRPDKTSVHRTESSAFEQMLRTNLLKFSNHAETRLAQRGIQMSADQLAKLEDAVQQAAAKGARESLILTADAAFIVNIKNRTVVTAIDHASLDQHVFTQIDSAVIVQS
jgi:flagellar operon protein